MLAILVSEHTSLGFEAMDSDEERGGKRRKKPDVGKKKRRKTIWGDNAGWRDATPADPMALLVGSEEGGFYSLEEIDGEVFDGAASLNPVVAVGEERLRPKRKKKHGAAEVPEDAVNLKRRKMKKKTKKSKADDVVAADETVDHGKPTVKLKNLIKIDNVAQARKIAKQEELAESEEIVEEGSSVLQASPVKAESGPKENALAKKRKRKHSKDVESAAEVVDFDLSAWLHLRLHPLLEKAIAALGLKEPTPIQSACIPAAAHQGKDVIGAAETGSGKTFAFGFPIFQRLLEEQEKALRKSADEAGEEQVAKFRSGPLRALIITPTRELALQVCDHLRSIGKFTSIRVVPIVGGMASQKQERLLKQRPEIVVATPGRLWELMTEGEKHLLELRALSFFVLDEADRMVQKGHFQELQSIIDTLPKVDKYGRCQPQDGLSEVEDDAQGGTVEEENHPGNDAAAGGRGVSKRRQTLVFSATLTLPENFKKKLKRGFQFQSKVESSIAALSERAGITAAVVDLTSKSIVAQQLVETAIECRDEEKEAYLYYVLKVHGCGQTIVFCTSIAAVRRISAILRLLELPVWPLHAQMQQRQRLKAMDRFRGSADAILIATDVAARGLDIPGVRTVIHFQLPHSAEVYVHRSGRTARAHADGCSITFVTPSDRSKYAALCGSLSKKEGLPAFPIDSKYLPAVQSRVTLAVQVDKLSRSVSQQQGEKSWLARNAEALGLDMEEDAGDQGKSKGQSSAQLKKAQQQLSDMLKQPLVPKSFSRKYVAGVGMSPLVAKQLQDVVGVTGMSGAEAGKKPKCSLVVIGHETVEPLAAVRKSMAEDSQHEPQTSEPQRAMLSRRKSGSRGRGRGRRK